MTSRPELAQFIDDLHGYLDAHGRCIDWSGWSNPIDVFDGLSVVEQALSAGAPSPADPEGDPVPWTCEPKTPQHRGGIPVVDLWAVPAPGDAGTRRDDTGGRAMSGRRIPPRQTMRELGALGFDSLKQYQSGLRRAGFFQAADLIDRVYRDPAPAVSSSTENGDKE